MKWMGGEGQKRKNHCKKLDILSHMTDPDYITLETKLIQEVTVGYWISNNKEIGLTKKVSFDKTKISHFGS